LGAFKAKEKIGDKETTEKIVKKSVKKNNVFM